MAKRKKSSKVVHEYLTLEVTDFEASAEAGVNWEVLDPKWKNPETSVYRYASDLRLEATCMTDGKRQGHPFEITIFSKDPEDDMVSRTLKDCHVIGDDHQPKYRKYRGRLAPVYNVPKGVGIIEKVRGQDAWSAHLWVPNELATHMLTLLLGIRPLFVHLHELRADRRRHIAHFTLSNSPEEEE